MGAAVTVIAERASMDLDEFYAEFWRARPVVYRGVGPGLLAPAVTHAESLAIRAAAPPEANRLVVRSDDRVFFVNQVDRDSRRIKQACAEFSRRMGWDHCTADLSVTDAADGGIGPHFDHSDNFVVQQQGVKHWRVGLPSDTPQAHRRLRMLDAEGFVPRAQESALVSAVDLRPGDVLYLPLFAPHRGEQAGCEPSVSVSLSYNAENALSRFLAPVLERLRDDPRWWQPLALDIANHPLRVAAARLEEATKADSGA